MNVHEIFKSIHTCSTTGCDFQQYSLKYNISIIFLSKVRPKAFKFNHLLPRPIFTPQIKHSSSSILSEKIKAYLAPRLTADKSKKDIKSWRLPFTANIVLQKFQLTLLHGSHSVLDWEYLILVTCPNHTPL